ncbi:Cone-rod homeobox protein [Holothuria leucospilota]|uniref:Cone-rod homeobox protein n=1 Tax=Holothuria leucospilota TaxID=206669 RepID=A0A9Q1HG21_HOLLE|nr:Cone-rod homeobox protein [Holothuria leucospilota]
MYVKHNTFIASQLAGDGIIHTAPSSSTGFSSRQDVVSGTGGDLLHCNELPYLKTKKAGRRQRTSFSMEQLEKLEHAFKCSPYPGINEREDLSAQIKIAESRIQVSG